MNEAGQDGSGVSSGRMDLVRKRFAQSIAAFASAAARVQEAEDTDAIHDLRVSVRALEAMLRTWAGLLDPRPRTAALRWLRRLRHVLGAARELEAHVALLERTAQDPDDPDDPATALLHRLRIKASRRTARARKRLRPEGLRHLLGRVDAATSSLGPGPAGDPDGTVRARAHVAELRAVALAAVESAAACEDEWLLQQARLAVRKWRYAMDSYAKPANGPSADLRPAVRQVQDALGAIHDRAALIGLVERYVRKRAMPGLKPVIERLKAEKRAEFRRFQALAGALGARSLVAAAALRSLRPPVTRAVTRAATAPTDERWERMAQWLLGTGVER
jgi:CHAD domain-containing protein